MIARDRVMRRGRFVIIREIGINTRIRIAHRHHDDARKKVFGFCHFLLEES